MKKIYTILLLGFFYINFTYSYTENELDSANILAERGVINIQSNPSDYRLDDTITRREFMKVVVKIVWEQVEDVCQHKFDDVIASDWACKYIEWALVRDFIASNNLFRPGDNITKAESMKLVLKARGIARIENSGDWRQDDMRTAYRKWIISTEYEDYDTYATRGWIFLIAATPTSWTWWGTSSSSSSGWNPEIIGDDWRNKVP